MFDSSFLIIVFIFCSITTPSLADRYIRRIPSPEISTEIWPEKPQEYLDPTFPSVLLPSGEPSCSLPLLTHDFAYTYGLPPVTTDYSPPAECPAPWDRVVLDLAVSCAGEQYDRIAAVWLDGAEILRTSTAEPTADGVFWRVRKDITRYSALLRRSGVVSMMLENLVNDEFTGVYHVNLSLDFYTEDKLKLGLGFRPWLSIELNSWSPGVGNRKMLSVYGDPADLIMPISENESGKGFWFRISNELDVHLSSVRIPVNSYRAALEVYVSYHGNDEFWYWNPPNAYIKKNNLSTGRGNGAYRDVFVTIDGQYVGSIVPFPVIFTGGINPLFWEPVVALGAFDLPSYYLDLTPFLGFLSDGKAHDVGIGVTDGIGFWLVDANLHVWLDPHSSSVTAQLISYQASKTHISRMNNFHGLNGTFQIEAARETHFSGWVNSSFGNLTADVDYKFKVKNLLEFMNDGNYKAVHMKVKSKMNVRIRKGQKIILTQGSHKYKCPLVITSSTLPGEKDTYTLRTNLSHTLYQQTSFRADTIVDTSSITDRQDADGWMLVHDHSVLNGSAGTHQTYQYRDKHGFYIRQVSARDGVLLNDNATYHNNLSLL